MRVVVEYIFKVRDGAYHKVAGFEADAIFFTDEEKKVTIWQGEEGFTFKVDDKEYERAKTEMLKGSDVIVIRKAEWLGSVV